MIINKTSKLFYVFITQTQYGLQFWTPKKGKFRKPTKKQQQEEYAKLTRLVTMPRLIQTSANITVCGGLSFISHLINTGDTNDHKGREHLTTS